MVRRIKINRLLILFEFWIPKAGEEGTGAETLKIRMAKLKFHFKLCHRAHETFNPLPRPWFTGYTRFYAADMTRRMDIRGQRRRLRLSQPDRNIVMGNRLADPTCDLPPCGAKRVLAHKQ